MKKIKLIIKKIIYEYKENGIFEEIDLKEFYHRIYKYLMKNRKNIKDLKNLEEENYIKF
jgi:hypothetical protein